MLITLATPNMLPLSQATGYIKRNCQKVVRKIKLAYLNLETTLVCTQLTKCFSDYHYNEAYREGGGYICPAQVFKST